VSLISGGLRVASTTTRREVLISGLLALLLLWPGSGVTPLIGRDESRFAVAAREMLERGDLVVPTYAGEDRYDKPILVYWCTMVSYQLLGVHERAARLPSQIAGAVVVMLVAWSARRRWGAGAGLLAGMLLVITPVFHVLARACTADMVMLVPTLVAMLALEQICLGQGGRRWAVLFWAGMALSILAKGPVGPACVIFTGVGLWALQRSWSRWQLVVAGLVLLLGWWPLGPVVLVIPVGLAAWHLLRSADGRQALARLRWQWGLLLAAVLVLPWAIAAHIATDGAFFAEAIGRHVVARSLTPLESHGGFPGFYLLTGLLVAFPWLGFMPSALRRLWSRLSAEPQLCFLVAWLLGPLVMLELLRTKLVHYWLISYPAGVLLVIGWLIYSSTEEVRVGRTVRITSVVTALLLAAAPVVAAIYLGLDDLADMSLISALPLVIGVLFWAFRGGFAPLRSLVLLQAGTTLYLLLLMLVFLPTLGSYLVGPQVVGRVPEVLERHEEILIYKVRDDELFFYLPEAVSCRTPACLVEWVDREKPFLGVARTSDLEKFRAEHPDHWLFDVEAVEGIDLGRFESTEVMLFRPSASFLPGAAAQ
jgi:4-amino-4-deoxy-L-arabinose transferase-like glycosyltransferase